MCVCVWVYVCVYMSVYISRWMWICICVSTEICVCIYICMCIYLCLRICNHLMMFCTCPLVTTGGQTGWGRECAFVSMCMSLACVGFWNCLG